MNQITAEEFAERRERLLEHVRAHALTGCVLFDDKYVQYFTGFIFLATERPVAFAVNVAGEMAAFVPKMELLREK